MSLPHVNKDIKYLCSSCSFGVKKKPNERPPSATASLAPVRVPAPVPAQNIDDCPICLNPLPDNPPITQLNCGHQFHKDCICDWFMNRNKRTCPMCRRVIKENEVNFLCQGFVREPPSRKRLSFDPEVLEDPVQRAARGIPPPMAIHENDVVW